MAVCKVVVLIVVSKCVLYHSKYICTTYLLGSIFITSFYRYVKLELRKSGCFSYQSGNSPGILIHVLDMNQVLVNSS